MYGGLAQGIGLALSEEFEDIKEHSTMTGAGFPFIKGVPDDLELHYQQTPRPNGPSAQRVAGSYPIRVPTRPS